MAMQTRTLPTSYCDITITESDGDGSVVLFIHGNSSCKEIFRNQLESKLGTAYRMIAMDLSGHGKSGNASDPSRTYTVPAAVSERKRWKATG